MKNSYTAGLGALLACMGFGLLIVGVLRYFGINFSSESLADESWIGANIPTMLSGVGLMLVGLFLMSTFRKTERSD